MKYNNINPTLTSELLESLGFRFDGYYYSDNLHPIQFLKTEEGFEVHLKTPGEMQHPLVKDYSDFIKSLLAPMQLYLQARMQIEDQSGNQQVNPQILAEWIADYWHFDEDINFQINVSQGGVGVSPIGPYTISLIMGGIEKRSMSIITSSGVMELMIEGNPSVLTIDYLEEVAKSALNCDQVDITISKHETIQ